MEPITDAIPNEAANSTCADELKAAFASSPMPDGKTPPEWFMVFPGGVHDVCLHRAGKPFEIQVSIDPMTPAELNKQLQAVNGRGKLKAYFDFDHESKSASAYPEAFRWQESPEPGVYAKARFTDAGLKAVLGRDYQSFSMTFFVDDVKAKPARVVCNAGAGLNFGGLVNEPAFSKNLPLMSKEAKEQQSPAGSAEQNQTETHMSEQNKAADSAELQAKESALQAAKAEADALKAQLTRINELTAGKAVSDAITNGQIPALDKESQEQWKKLITANPENAALLAKMPKHAPQPVQASAARVEVGSSPLEAIKAIDKHGTHNAELRAQIYHKEIAPMLAKGDFGMNIKDVLQASNSPGTLVGNIVSQRVLELVAAQVPAMSAFTTDFSDAQVAYNQSIITRYMSIPAVGTYHTSNGYVDGDDATASDVTVTMNAHQFTSAKFGANELSGTVRNLFGEMSEALAAAVAHDIVFAAYALITEANFTNAVLTANATEFGRTTLGDAQAAQDDLGVPIQNRVALLSPQYYAILGRDQIIATQGAFQMARAETIEKGVLPDVQGYKVIKCPKFTTYVGAGIKGFCMTKSAICIATRLPLDYATALPGANFGSIATVTNPMTGLSVAQTMYVNHDKGTSTLRLAWMRGQSKGQVSVGQIIKG